MKSKKLNIAIFHLAFIYSGGGEKLVLQEYDGLRKKGHDVSIFTTVIDAKKSFPEIIKKYKIKTFLPNLKIFRGHEAFLTILSCILVPFYAYRFKRYNAILACNQPSPWLAWIIHKLYGIPYVSYLAQPTRFLHPRKIDKKTGLFFSKKASESIASKLMMTTFKRFSDWADKVSIKGSSSVLVNGDYIKTKIERIYGVRTITCPSGRAIEKIITGKRKPYLLITNRHFAQKKFEYGILSLNSILSIMPDIRLIITGMDTYYTLEMKNLVDELGINKSVIFAGYVNEKSLRKLYREAKVYLYTAPDEDFGMGVIEAMSYGTPVVAWNTAGPSKIITDNEDGLLAIPFDIADYTRKVINLLTDKRLTRKIGRNAISKVKNKFSLEKHIDLLESELLGCANQYKSLDLSD